MSHLNVLGNDSKGTMERSTVNNILDINDRMPRDECQKASKSQKTPKESNMYQNKVLNRMSTKSSKVILRP